ncbi:tannase/feruloyl esterase family alpha/beta hydrolase [Streptomyces sp. NPDC005202]|uniref:tannase/feruloyl esterase family alpha/beta hydrolase n=1 Tax=Streptomyces sp. NPDC005202 TaxID=3157021 RepID=UPI0033B5EFDD
MLEGSECRGRAALLEGQALLFLAAPVFLAALARAASGAAAPSGGGAVRASRPCGCDPTGRTGRTRAVGDRRRAYLADRLIFPQGTVDYRDRVEAVMGGAATDTFYRVHLAPGADHCSGGGPVPTDPLAAVVDWVEHGHAPATLPAATTGADGRKITRDLCRYPLVSRCTGHGDPGTAAAYACRQSGDGR